MKLRNETYVPGLFNLMDKFLTDDYETMVKSTTPAVNIVELDKSFNLQLMAPGLTKEDIKIKIEKNLLTIAYQKSTEKTTNDKQGKTIRKEFELKEFSRTFTLNEGLDNDNIEAVYENGILNITIPKTEVKEVEVKTLQVK